VDDRPLIRFQAPVLPSVAEIAAYFEAASVCAGSPIRAHA
jgi:hypothetical protein